MPDGDQAATLYERISKAETEKFASGHGETISGFNEVREWFNMMQEKLRASYNASTYIVPDESMILWVGKGDVHIRYSPCNPIP